jgi:Protein of unknown function (DUF2442)
MSDDRQAEYEKSRPVAVEIRGDKVYVALADGRVIGNPLAWHPWLLSATPAQLANVKLYHLSVWWPDLDEGLDIQGMMQGIQPHAVKNTMSG